VIGALKVLFAFKVKNLPERAAEKFSALR